METKHQHLDPNDPRAVEVLGSLRRVFTDDGPWPVMLHGRAGSGKTSVALIILDRVAGRYENMRTLHGDYIRAMRGELRSGDRVMDRAIDEREFMSGLAQAQLLVVDEIGKRREATDAETDTLHQILEARAGRPTIYISNRPAYELMRVYDQAVSSRLCAGTVIEYGGSDRRLAPKG